MTNEIIAAVADLLLTGAVVALLFRFNRFLDAMEDEVFGEEE